LDPEEKHNLAHAETQLSLNLHDRLHAILNESEAMRCTDNSLKIDPNRARQLARLGYFGAPGKAAFDLDSTTRSDAKDLISLHEQRKVLVGALDGKHYTEARALCAQLLLEHSNIGCLHNLAGHIAMATGQFEEVVRHYQNYLKLRPDDHRARDSMAIAFHQLGDLNQAYEQWEKAIELNPDFCTAHLNLASAFYRQGRIEGAVRHWREAVRIKPDETETLNNLAWILSSSPQADLRDPQLALKYASRACNLSNFEQPGYLYTLSAAYAAANQLPRAIQTARHAHELASYQGKTELKQKIQNRLQLMEKSLAGGSY
jgi:tetratricopeptide (TPR) repeat protein